MSITISQSYIEGATGLVNPKQTPQGLASLQKDASRKTLHGGISAIKKHEHLASQPNLESVKTLKEGGAFTDGWNFNEPKHDLSMSSWALTSFIKNCDD